MVGLYLKDIIIVFVSVKIGVVSHYRNMDFKLFLLLLMCGLPSLVMADEGKLNNSWFLTVLFTEVGKA